MLNHRPVTVPKALRDGPNAPRYALMGFVAGFLFKALASFVFGILGASTFFVVVQALPTVQKMIDPIAASDAIAIANTYIVFTSLIAVAITVLLAGAAIWFAQQYSTDREQHLHNVCVELMQQLSSEESARTLDLAEALMQNQGVIQYVDEQLRAKIDQLIRQRMSAPEEPDVDQAVVDALKGA